MPVTGLPLTEISLSPSAPVGAVLPRIVVYDASKSLVTRRPRGKNQVGLGVHAMVTGITTENEHTAAAHGFARNAKIHLLGGTHYSTERFACEAMTGYFTGLGLSAEFLPGTPVLEDME